jgi:imidazolonepropionase-like amidohydrolase
MVRPALSLGCSSLGCALVFVCCAGPSSHPSAVGPDDAATTGETGGAAPKAGSVVLRGGSIVDPKTRTVSRQDLYICGGVIVDASTGPGCAPRDIDVAGKYLVPGLNDMHIHARGVTLGSQDSRDMNADQEAPLFLWAGVTSFLDSMNDEAMIFPIRDGQRAQGAYPGADIFASGGTFTPTGGHGTEYGLPTTAYHLVDTPADVPAQLDALAALHPDVVKIMYDHRGPTGGPDVKDGEIGSLGVAMRKDVMQAIVSAATARGLKTQVHIGVWGDARDAIEAGATLIAHLGEPTIPDDIVALAAQKGVYWVPTISLYRGLVDIMKDQSLLDDPLLRRVSTPDVIDSYRTANIWLDPDTQAWLATHVNDATSVAKLRAAGVKIVTGTDTVELGILPGWSMHRELALLVEYGLSTWEALAAATTTAGDFMGHDWGIEPGAEGNVVVLDASPVDDIGNTTKIHAVVHHGLVVDLPATGYVPAPVWSGSTSWGKGDAGLDAAYGADGNYAGLTDLQCQAIPDNNGACEDCCAANHPAGYAAYLQALAACACTAGTCETECAASLCTNPPGPPDDACWSCAYPAGDAGGAGGACSTAADTCAACTPYTECTGDATYSETDGCQSK